MKNIKKIISLFLILFLIPLASSAQVFKSNQLIFDAIPLNLQEITQSAGKVFTGVCTKIEEIENDPLSNLEVVKFTFRVAEPIKGLNNETEITFKQWRPTVSESSYKVGEKYVIFLYPESKLGLTSTVGHLQGKFLVEKKGVNRGVEYASNSFNNIGLIKNFRTKKAEIKDDKILQSYIDECSEKGKPIRYKDFIKAIRSFLK